MCIELDWEQELTIFEGVDALGESLEACLYPRTQLLDRRLGELLEVYMSSHTQQLRIFAVN